MSEKNAHWLMIFNEIEKQMEPVNKDTLRVGVLHGSGYTVSVDFRSIANALWTFIGKHLVGTIYSNRIIVGWREQRFWNYGGRSLLNMRVGLIR